MKSGRLKDLNCHLGDKDHEQLLPHLINYRISSVVMESTRVIGKLFLMQGYMLAGERDPSSLHHWLT